MASGASLPRALALRAPNAAQALTLLALAAHTALWGFASPWAGAALPGALLAAAGIGWMAWAWWCLRRAGNPTPATDAPQVFVDHGPFTWGRHPMYLGIAVSMLGTGLALGVPFMVPAAAAFVVLMDRVHIPFEEAQARRAFGAWYSDYASDVPRWF